VNPDLKLLTIIVHEQAKDSLVEILNSHEDVTSWIITTTEGHAFGTKDNPFETARDLVLGYVPRLKFEIVLSESALEDVVDRISLCKSCIEGTGLWYSTSLHDYGIF